MVITYNRVKDKPKLLRAMTGLDRDEFEELLPPFQMAWAAYAKANHPSEQERQRQAGGGRKPALRSLADKLLFILYYFKVYPLQEIVAFEFGMGQSQACTWIHVLSEVQQQALGVLNCLPERDPREVATKLAQSGEIKYGIDGTERRIQRPKDPDKQRQYYSGKKHTHTVKNNVIVTLKSRQVKYLSQTYEGKTHDKRICDQEQPTFPSNSILYKDTGFQGYEPAGVETHQPKKKPRGQELSAKDKKRNRRISKVRIVAEHVIAGVKRCRIVKDVLRNTKAMFDDLVMEVACGLHNFRTALRSKRRRAKPYFR
jgi:DDE superfamily endonuclease/Helix-turn-helix of DDE superfamily endonuclease